MRRTTRNPWLIHLLLVAIFAALFAGVVALQHRNFRNVRAYRPFQEKLFLPSGENLKLAALGFDNLYADLLWLRAIQAFGGKWYVINNDMTPILHYFDVVTDLDPQFIEAYKMGNLVIGDEGGDFPRSLEILRKGMVKNFGVWELPYLGIYNTVFQMNDYDQARFFALMAERCPGRPEFVARMQEFVERRAGRLEIAYRMNLQYLLEYIDAGNEQEARIITKRFVDVLNLMYLERLREAARQFIREYGRDPLSIQELVYSRAWTPYRAPTMESVKALLDEYKQRNEPLSPHFEEIHERSIVEIPGEPPEPNGFIYYIVPEWIPGQNGEEPTTGTVIATRENADTLPDSHFNYIVNAWDIFAMLRDYTHGMNVQILSFHNAFSRFPKSIEELVAWANLGRLPTEEEIKAQGFNYRDPLGGEFSYDPETGIFICSTEENPPRLRPEIFFY